MLRVIPRYPRKTTVRDLKVSLALAGFKTTDRTIQRDLVELSGVFPLSVDDREKPFGWSWQKDAKSFDLPGLTAAEALTWVMAEQQLSHLLPQTLLDHLAPQFRAAHDRLDRESHPQRNRNWLNKVRTALPSQPLVPAQVDPEVQRTISDALLHERQVEIRYRGKGKADASVFRVHPLALVQRGVVLYLFGRLFDYPNTRILALHRIEAATLLEAPATPPPDFDIDDKVSKGVWSFGDAEAIRLKCRFFNGAGDHLLETPLSEDQIYVPGGKPGSVEITATVFDTPQLRWWLLGFGYGVELLEPLSLRQEVAVIATRIAAVYVSS